MPCTKTGKKDANSSGHTSETSKSQGHHGDCTSTAQLSRLWIQTPPAIQDGQSVEAEPRMSLVDVHAEKGVNNLYPEVVCTAGKVSLPPGSLVQIVLPSIFYRPGAKRG